jgi:cobalamin biosynthesis protein CobT
MAGRRILNRKDLRADYDAAERRKDDEDRDDEDEEESEDEDEDEKDTADEESEEEEKGDEEEAEEAPPKKRKAPPAPKPKAKPRSRAAKVVRMRVVWGVFNNSNQCVATYEYPKRKDADEHAAKLTAEKRNTHFVQPVKEPMEEKKEK